MVFGRHGSKSESAFAFWDGSRKGSLAGSNAKM